MKFDVKKVEETRNI